MAKSKIQWTDDTDNVFVVEGADGLPNGWFCEKVSEGCKFCYAERLNGTPFYGGNGLAYAKGQRPKLMLRRDILEGWTRKRVPKKRFVNSMTDTFGEWVPDEWLDELFAYMSLAPTQTFQVLTKRAERMCRYFNAPGVDVRVEQQMELICGANGWCPPDLQWPLPNVWLGVSVENQARADERIPYLVGTPGAVRFLSVEPLLGPVNLLATKAGDVLCRCDGCMTMTPDTRLDWVITGGESGHNARPMHPAWVRSIRDQCQAAGVPYFFKQWGEWAPVRPGYWGVDGRKSHPAWGLLSYNSEFTSMRGKPLPYYGVLDNSLSVVRIGKHRSGRVLDGREWNEFPQELVRA